MGSSNNSSGDRFLNHQRCTFCSKKFKLRDILKLEDHLKTEKCSGCDRTFSCQSGMTAHRKLSPNCVAKYRCSKCEKPLSSNQNLQRHTKLRNCTKCSVQTDCYHQFCNHFLNCNGLEPKCIFCGEKQVSEAALADHSRPFKCPRCGFEQPCSSLLANHLELCRFVLTAESPKPKSLERNLKCPDCKKIFSEGSEFDSHKEQHAQEEIVIQQRIRNYLSGGETDAALFSDIVASLVKVEKD
ncbi:zinc finger protein 845-like [Neocloeon triangulifer]|uniref:zinc finger protein 845-like n=1 Tax=Neocloeon triangulifer TaxID=2078957 RepID=UPI00286F9722|nr:zinc finger protein 845-like [Neocloeon triangulifer]